MHLIYTGSISDPDRYLAFQKHDNRIGGPKPRKRSENYGHTFRFLQLSHVRVDLTGF